MNENGKKYGYIPSEHKPEHLCFGTLHCLGGQPVNPGGHWLAAFPTLDEQQNIGVEPMDCTSYGTTNALETLAKFLYQDSTEWSERLLAYMSGTTPQGNDPLTVLNTVKKKGLVPLADWPINAALQTWAEYYQVPPQNLLTKALEYLAHYGVDGEWVTTDPTSLKAALEYSPLGVAGYAWELDTATGLYVTPPGAQPDHWFMLGDYVDGQYWVVMDSYQSDIKHLAWDYQFAEAMRYSLVNNIAPGHQSAWQAFLKDMLSWLGL